VTGRQARWLLAGVLAVCLAWSTAMSLAGSWVRALVYDTDVWVSTVGPLVEQPAVQAALTQQITGQLTDQVQQQLDQLPAFAQNLLAGPVDRLEQVVESTVTDVVSSDQFAAAWVGANEAAHEQVVGSLTGRSGALDIADGVVSIDNQVFVEAGRQGLDQAGFGVVAQSLPDVSGSFVLLQSDSLAVLQAGLRVLDAVGGWFWLVAAALAVGVVLAAPSRRRGVVVAAAAVAAGAVVLALGLALLRAAYLGSTAVLPDEAKDAIFSRFTAPLWSSTLLVLAVASAVAVVAWGVGLVASHRHSASGQTTTVTPCQS
jgi:hypothetical protein